MLNRRQLESIHSNPAPHPCSRCSMSRRSFLGTMTACTAALSAARPGLVSLHAAPQSDEIIDLAALRPRPKVRVISVAHSPRVHA